MIDSITTSGLIATEPQHTVSGDGVARTNFRLASSPRKFNRSTKMWEYGPTNWFTVTAFRHLALNLSRSIHKGDRVIVMGRMRVREWKKDERTGIVVEITADAVGHDLSWGTAVYERNLKSIPVDAASSSADQTSNFDPDEHGSVSNGSAWATEPGAGDGRNTLAPDGDPAFGDDAQTGRILVDERQ